MNSNNYPQKKTYPQKKRVMLDLTKNPAPAPANKNNAMDHGASWKKKNQINDLGTFLRRIVFTLPNYTKAEVEALRTFECKWMCFGKEVCPTTGTKHLQGAVLFRNQIRFGTLKKKLAFKRAWIAPMLGTPEQSLKYCSKEDKDPFVCGEIPEPGKRNDIHYCNQMLTSKSLSECVQDESFAVQFVRHHRGFQALKYEFIKFIFISLFMYILQTTFGINKL